MWPLQYGNCYCYCGGKMDVVGPCSYSVLILSLSLSSVTPAQPILCQCVEASMAKIGTGPVIKSVSIHDLNSCWDNNMRKGGCQRLGIEHWNPAWKCQRRIPDPQQIILKSAVSLVASLKFGKNHWGKGRISNMLAEIKRWHDPSILRSNESYQVRATYVQIVPCLTLNPVLH